MSSKLNKNWLEEEPLRMMLGFSCSDPVAGEIMNRLKNGKLGITQSHYLVGRDKKDLEKEAALVFDPQLYVRTMKRLGVKVFYHHAKNHAGISCYPTKVGFSSTLMGKRDFFGELVKAFHSAGIQVGAMYQVGMDELSALQHSDWQQMDATGKRTLFRLCHNNPQWKKIVLEQTREIVSGYEICAFMYDELSFGWGNIGLACYCPHCRELFRKEIGEDMPEKKDWDNPLWRRFIRWRYENIAAFLREANRLIKSIRPETLHTNIWYAGPNAPWPSGWLTELTAPIFDYALCDVMGVGHISMRSRYYRASLKGKSEIAVGAAFAVKTPDYGYNDNDVPESRTMFLADCFTALANGVTPGYESIGFYNKKFWSRQKATMCPPGFESEYLAASREIKKRAKWLSNVEPVRHAAVVLSENSRDFYGQDKPDNYLECYYGWFKALMDRQIIFEVLMDYKLTPEELSKYSVIILPATACLSNERADFIRDYVRAGGGLIASYVTSLFDEAGNRRSEFALKDLLGVSYAGGLEDDFCIQAESPVRSRDQIFLNFDRKHPLLNGVAVPGQRLSCPAPSLYVKPALGGRALGWLEIFRRHGVKFEGRADAVSGQGEREVTKYPVAVMNSFGKGTSVYFPAKLAGSYGIHGHYLLHRMLINAVNLVTAGRSPIEVKAPKCVEVNAFRQKPSGRLIVHLVNYQAMPYRAHLNNNMSYGGNPPVEEVLPVYGIEISFALPLMRGFKKIYQEPEHKKLALKKSAGGRLIVTVPRLDMHTMVVAE